MVAAGKKMAAGAGDGRGAALVGGGEGGDRGAPREATGLLGVGVDGEAGEGRPHRH